MKKLLATLLSVCALALTGYSQTAVTNAVVTLQTTTNPAPTIMGGLDQIGQAFLAGNTNWYFATYGMHAGSLNNKWGGGIGAFYPLSKYVVAGTRADWVNGGFWMPSGNATLQLPLELPFSIRVTPLAYAGIGVPLSGATYGNIQIPGSIRNNNDQPTAILGYGLAVSLWTSSSSKYNIEAAWDRETWSGFPGTQDRFGIVLHIKLGTTKK